MADWNTAAIIQPLFDFSFLLKVYQDAQFKKRFIISFLNILFSLCNLRFFCFFIHGAYSVCFQCLILVLREGWFQ